jgi:chemotaxis protein histidine kinase CheA
MGEDEKGTVINPPDTLKGKVDVGGPGAVNLDVLEKAEAVIADLGDDYIKWVNEDLLSIQKASDSLQDGAGDAKDVLEKIFRIAHDMKGQGGSFEYNLITAVGDSLCRFIEKMESPSSSDTEVIQIHIDTMKMIISQEMKGDGGAAGETLLNSLDQIVAKKA